MSGTSNDSPSFSLTKARWLAVTNMVVVVAVVAWNYWTAVNGFAGNRVGELSDVYRTLATPAGYAFSIWGLIFLGLGVNAVYQLRLAFGSESPPEMLQRLGPWLILTNVLNGLWVFVWLLEYTAISVVVLTSMVVCLQIAMRRLDMEIWDAPMKTIALVWWPIVIYAGWVTLAALVNLSAYLSKTGVVPGNSVAWAVLIIVVAGAINLVLVKTRNLREHALVGIWALVAIAVRQWGDEPVVAWSALGMAAVLGVAISIHAISNRATLPGIGRPGRTTQGTV